MLPCLGQEEHGDTGADGEAGEGRAHEAGQHQGGAEAGGRGVERGHVELAARHDAGDGEAAHEAGPQARHHLGRVLRGRGQRVAAVRVRHQAVVGPLPETSSVI